MEKVGDHSPAELEGTMFLTHDQLRLLEGQVWDDYLELIDRGELDHDTAQTQFMMWRARYIDLSDL